jgi:NADH dehydrogenase
MAADGPVRGPIFLTGGTGFIGRRVVRALAQANDRPVRCLARRDGMLEVAPNIHPVRGDLEAPASYAAALQGVEQVLHLAAKVGRGRPEEYVRANLQATRSLLQACRDAGVGRFVYVSSIAAIFPDKTGAHYAVSKWQTEDAVRASGLDYLIIRPTFVFGDDSPIWNSLAGLAALPVLPLLGSGRIRVQPIHVDDVAAYLIATLDESAFANREVELGGPDIVSFEELLRRMHRAQRGGEARVVHLPGRAAIGVLSWLERLVGRPLPVTAGQLAAFVNDSTARPDPSVAVRAPQMRTLDEMLAGLVPRA